MTTKSIQWRALKVVQGHKNANMLGLLQKPTDSLSSVWKKSHSLHRRWKYCLLSWVLKRCCLDTDQPRIKNSDRENHYGSLSASLNQSGNLSAWYIERSVCQDLMGKSNGVIHFNILCYSWNESPTMHQCWCWETLPSPSKGCSSAHTHSTAIHTKGTFDASTLLVRTG